MSHMRNVAIIAHVDHGKTSLVDKLLYQSNSFRKEELDKLAGGQHGLIMDSSDLERERGITILAKNCAIRYTDMQGEEYKINIIDTPGHADFGGEVERVLKMADGVLLVVDAFDGPMPQTRFVMSKALELGIKPIVIVNKSDRPDARHDAVVDEVFDLLCQLGADDETLEFTTLFTSAKEGWTREDMSKEKQDMRPIFEAIIKDIPCPSGHPEHPLQMLVTSLDHSDYVGVIGIGRVFEGTLREGDRVTVIGHKGNHTQQKVLHIHQFEGLGKKQVTHVSAGDICAITGLDPIDIGDTIACAEDPNPLPIISVDDPTMHTLFRVNDGPFVGRDGDKVTSRQIKDRLDKELQHNVALRVEPGKSSEEFKVSGRGLMHIGILLENMRREGFELCVGKPQVIYRDVNGEKQEPIERLVIDCPCDCQSSVMSLLGERRTEMIKMETKSGADGFIHMEFMIPSRGLFGLNARMLTATRGRAIMHHTFERYEPVRGNIPSRQAGVMISMSRGQITPYALDGLYDRGIFFTSPGDDVYEGQIVGEHCKEGDIVVNPVKPKQLSNVRSSGKDDSARIRPPRIMSLEACLEYIQDDELVELTPKHIRTRKRLLTENERKRFRSGRSR
ncbi:MAG: translational GTPase TypA [Planctomycetes bacterium]|nr:translational GTPase TypA [Planctomycetota bacterium]